MPLEYGSRFLTSYFGWLSPQPSRKCSLYTVNGSCVNTNARRESRGAFRQIEGFFTPSLRLPVPETLTESRPPAASCLERDSSDPTPTAGNGRYLRSAVVRCVVFARLSPKAATVVGS
jgi:hypothetical protein